ncbi:MAG: SIMPL domain-containing protein [Candidatus Cyclobacteriaceae bacterium M2_1C_046]
MNRLFVILFLLIPAGLVAQNNSYETRRIEVWGEAEKIIVPNEIYTSITIKEYKEMGKIISLNQIEKELVKAVSSLNIPKENLRVENIYGYNWDWKEKKSEEFLASKSFELKTDDLKKINDLLAKLDPEGLHRVSVKRYTHTDLDKMKEELKIEALKNAQQKAKSLLNSIGEGLGKVLEVQEVQQHGYRMEQMDIKAAGREQMEYQSDVEFQKITITSSIRAVFGIED